MSRTKKVLSLVMAVALLFNVLGVISFAACANDKVVGIVAESDDALVAGGQVTVDFSFELPAGTDYTTYKFGLFQLLVSYNADVLTPVKRTWGPSVASFMGDDAIFNKDSGTVHAWVTPNISAEEAAIYTGSTAVQAKISTGNDFSYTGTTGYPIGAIKDVIFSVTFNVAEDYDGTSTANVAILTGSFKNANKCYLRDITTKNNGKLAKDGSEIDFTEASLTLAPKAAANKIYAVENGKQVQWADKANDKINLGVKAGFKSADIDLALNGTTSTKIKFVGAMVSKNGGEAARGTTPFVYDVNRDGSEYQYRVVIKDVDRTSEDVYTVTFFAEDFDGNIITGDTTTITAAEVISKLPA